MVDKTFVDLEALSEADRMIRAGEVRNLEAGDPFLCIACGPGYHGIGEQHGCRFCGFGVSAEDFHSYEIDRCLACVEFFKEHPEIEANWDERTEHWEDHGSCSHFDKENCNG